MRLKAFCYKLKKDELEKAIKLAGTVGTPLDYMYSEVTKSWVIVVGIPREE